MPTQMPLRKMTNFVWIRNGLCQILAGWSGRLKRPI